MNTFLNGLKAKSLNIMVVGDVMLDEFHWCQVSRISPEAPVPICRVDKTVLVPGGAANVANNIKALSATPYLFGVVGGDSSGEKLIDALMKIDVNTDNLLKDPLRPTTLKSRIIAHHQQVVRVDREVSDLLSEAMSAQFLYKLKMFGAHVDGIVISDYNKGTLTDALLQAVISYGKQKNIIVVIDPKGDAFGKYKGASVLTPNFSEFQGACHKIIDSEEMLYEEAKVMIASLDLQAIAITRSEKGATIVLKNGDRFDVPAKTKEVYDITGAGDTVISVLVLALSAGYDMQSAIQLAISAAGVVVGKLGTATVTLEELSLALDRHE